VIESHSKSLYFIHQVGLEYLKQLQEVYSGTNLEALREEDFDAVLKAIKDTNGFVKIEGRAGYAGFENVPDNIYAHKNRKDQEQWAQEHIKRYAKYGYLHTDSTLKTSKQSLDIEMELDANDEFVFNLRSRPIRRAN
jgi:hypothetical protein